MRSKKTNKRSSQESYRRSNRGASNQSSYYARNSAHARQYATQVNPDASDSSTGGRRANNSDSGAHASHMTQGAYTKVRKRRRRRRTIIIVVIILAVLLFGGAGAAFAYYQSINSGLQEGVDQDLRDALAASDLSNGEPFYVLLMGIDGSAAREKSEQYAGDTFRSDSIMLTRVDPKNMKVTFVSLHRDTLIDMGENGENKLNAAHAIGGPAYAVEVISDFAGVDIAHYAEINFDGFKDIVDALGGIEVNVPMEIDDDKAGGHLDAGKQTLNGKQALILCRSRHAYDDYGDGDVYRAANQRLVISAIIKKVLSSDVGTMANTVSSLTDYVTTDMSVSDILAVADMMKDLDTKKDIYSGMEPTESEYIDDTWYEIVDVEAWQTMMERVNEGLPPTEEDEVDEASGTVLASTGSGATDADSDDSSKKSSTKKSGSVAVRNGNGIDGAGAEAAEIIEGLGYQNVDAGDADSFDYPQTMVIYREDNQEKAAKEIAKALGADVVMLNDGTYAFDTGFLVVLGADWKK